MSRWPKVWPKPRVGRWAVLLLAACGAPAWTAPPEPQPERPPEALLFDQMPRVVTATLYAKTLLDAPSRATVITRKEIQRFGYRTLAEVLSNVTGFYLTQDGVDSFIGVRGFSLLGDYNTRVLVMLNGHALTDNVYGAMYMFGENFGLDMDLVERIEVVRGPTSSLYGSNGVFATVNIFTRPPVDAARGYVSAEYGGSGTKKIVAAGSAYLGRGANLLVEASGLSASGRSAFVENPFDPARSGWAHRLDSARGYHTFAQLTWKDWSVTTNFGALRTTDDGGWFGTAVGDSGTWNRDAHNFVVASWRRPMGPESLLVWRVSYDQYRFDAGYTYPAEDGVALSGEDVGRGDWLSTRFVYRAMVPGLGPLVVGAEGRADLRVLQEYREGAVDKPSVYASRRNASYGVFAQQEVELSEQWSFLFGLRGDDSRLYRRSFTPRAGIVYKHSPKTAIKYLYGRAFRDPSAYERFYVPSPGLAPERAKTYEVVLERQFSASGQLAVSAYHYSLHGLIEGRVNQQGFMQFDNGVSRHANGVELEGTGRPLGRMETSGGFAVQFTRSPAGESRLLNSPRVLASWRASIPLVCNRLFVSPAVRYTSRRRGGYATWVPSRFVADVTVSLERMHRDFDVVWGVRNLGGKRWLDPMSEEHRGSTFPLAGRTAFVKLIWHVGE